MQQDLSRGLSKKSSNQRQKDFGPWDEAVSEAQKQVEETRQKFARLAESLKTLEALRDSGAPFPGQSKSDIAA